MMENERAARPGPNSPGESAQRRRLDWLTEPLVLFPLLAVLLLGIQWGAALSMISARQTSVIEVAEIHTRELADTYEAHLLRSLHDITRTMSLLEYVMESGDVAGQLSDLAGRGMLPPALFYAVSVVDADGEVIASTHSFDPLALTGENLPENLPNDDSLQLGFTRPGDRGDRWWLDFRRAVRGSGASDAGVALIVSVDAEFLVSGYEEARLGQSGVLGIVGEDGVIRVLRRGDEVAYEGRVPVEALLAVLDHDPTRVGVFEYPTDGQERYTSAREIFGFPMVLTLGLSLDEQHSAVRAENRRTLWQSTWTSVVLLLVLGLLGRMSLQLQRSRAAVLDEQIAHARHVEYLAFHDGLTGLPNRGLFSHLLHQGIQKAKRDSEQLAVLFLDLDKFKLINDTLGHDAGDQLLQQVGQRVHDVLRASDVVARLGGDEFIILLLEVDNDQQIVEVAQKVLAAVGQPYRLAGADREITVSVGISVYPRDGEDEQTLIKHADTAMYTAKQSGRDRYCFYAEGLEGEPGKS